MSATAWTVGRYVVETLAANGIDTVFGIPGVHNIELYRGLEFARLRHVLVRHEQNAGFAADGYARVSGCAAAKPAFCSWRTSTWRRRANSRPRYSSMLCTPGMPNTVSMPLAAGVSTT